MLPAVTAFDLGFLAYFPLQNGLLTGKYTRGQAPAAGKVTRFKPHLLEQAPWDGLDQLTEFAAKRELTLVEVAYGWLLAQPGVTTLVTGATSPAQVAANASATTWRPTPAEETELRSLFAGDLSGAPAAPPPAKPRPSDPSPAADRQPIRDTKPGARFRSGIVARL